MKDSLIELGSLLLNKNKDFKNHVKTTYYNEANECLNHLEKTVCGIISDTWCYFDESPKNEQELIDKFNEINEKYLEFVSYKDTHKTKLSENMFNILTEIELELFQEKQSIQTLFFIKSDILDNLEERFIQQLKKDKKILEKGKKL